MSNPLINRWGFNLFWYNFWYSDKNSYLQYSMDRLITKLLFTYINFGLLFTKNIFFSFYWYKKINLEITNFFEKNNSLYFRLMEHKNKVTGELTRFFTRITKKDIYFSKIWILRYHGWIIINMLSFQPVKKKKIFRRNRRYLALPLNYSKNCDRNINILTFLRYKIYINFLLKNFIIKKNLYYFF